MPTVSVIMPVYQVAAYVERAARSVLGQTYADLELIAVDDGSTDGSGGVLDALARADARLIVLHQANAGAPAARNRALEMARGEYVCFADADDWLEPEMIGSMVSLARAHGLRYTALRYFNASGADPSGEIGEAHDPETHLIPLVLQVPLGKRAHISIFGGDYPTEDGTCVRDYIHVTDLAAAHILALDYLLGGGESDVFNLGNGVGFSVKQIIDAAREVTGHPIPAEMAPRRPGDPARLVASSEKARRVLGWRPRHDDIREIIDTAWRWHQAHPSGYRTAP